MEITYYGQSSFEIIVGEKKLLFDPFISPNPQAADINLESINPDYLLLTHGHADHVADAETILNQSNAQLISNFEIVNWYKEKGIKNGHSMNHGGSYTFEFGKVKMVNAVHSSSMPDGSYGGNPAGFVISTLEGVFYHAGDTALHQDMKQIGTEFNLDFAFLPIVDNYTMGIEDALIACDYIGIKKIIGMHFNTFPIIEIDTNKAVKLAQQEGIELIIPVLGKSFSA